MTFASHAKGPQLSINTFHEGRGKPCQLLLSDPTRDSCVKTLSMIPSFTCRITVHRNIPTLYNQQAASCARLWISFASRSLLSPALFAPANTHPIETGRDRNLAVLVSKSLFGPTESQIRHCTACHCLQNVARMRICTWHCADTCWPFLLSLPLLLVCLVYKAPKILTKIGSRGQGCACLGQRAPSPWAITVSGSRY